MKLKPGDKFNRLTVKQFMWRINRQAYFQCFCECGKHTIVRGSNLKNNNTKSCGCLCGENHGLRYTPEYNIWTGMKQRCYNPKDLAYHNYGGRGIAVCKRWRESFSAFYSDMGPRPQDLTLERKDNNGNYEPSNCKWATLKEQRRNSRRTHIIKFDNKSLCVVDWAKEVGLNRITLFNRLGRGWSIERALTQKVRKHG